MTPPLLTSIGLFELVGLAYILVCSGIPPNLTSQASKLHLSSSTLVSLSQIVDLKNYFTNLVVLYPKIEKFSQNMEQNVKICYLCLQLHPTLAIWPHFPQKKGAECTIPAIDIFPTKTDFASKYLFKIAKGIKDLSSISSQKST